MRKIKFRLRDFNNKIVGYEKWYVGKLDKEQFYVANPGYFYSKDKEYWNPTYIEHRYKDQFTGFSDKNGKDIYEGDIVKTYWQHNSIICSDYIVIGIVEFIECFAQFKIAFVKDSEEFAYPFYDFERESIDGEGTEVIGNIYENPKLKKLANN